MENSLYNIEQIVEISKYKGGNYAGYDYTPSSTLKIFGYTLITFQERYSWGDRNFSCSKEFIENNKLLYKGTDNKFYYCPSITITFSNKTYKEIPFNTIEKMEEKFNWWKTNYPNLIEL